MGFTRKFIGALGIEGEKVDELITAHNEVVEGLKTERDKLRADLEAMTAEHERYKTDLEQAKQFQTDVAALKTENGQLKEQLNALKESSAKEADELKAKLDTVTKEYDGYKLEQTNRETASKKQSAYRSMLKEIGVGSEWTDDIMKITDIGSLKLDDNGNLAELDTLKKEATSKYGKFIEISGKQGAKTPTPPKNTNAKMTREEIYKKDDKGRYVLDTAERQKALTELLSHGE